MSYQEEEGDAHVRRVVISHQPFPSHSSPSVVDSAGKRAGSEGGGANCWWGQKIFQPYPFVIVKNKTRRRDLFHELCPKRRKKTGRPSSVFGENTKKGASAAFSFAGVMQMRRGGEAAVAAVAKERKQEKGAKVMMRRGREHVSVFKGPETFHSWRCLFLHRHFRLLSQVCKYPGRGHPSFCSLHKETAAKLKKKESEGCFQNLSILLDS